jgi:hypothetical protein
MSSNRPLGFAEGVSFRPFGIKICLECFETGSLDRFVGHRNSRLYA